MRSFLVWRFVSTKHINDRQDEERIEAKSAEDAAIQYARKYGWREAGECLGMSDIAVKELGSGDIRTFDVYRPDLVAGETSFLLKSAGLPQPRATEGFPL